MMRKRIVLILLVFIFAFTVTSAYSQEKMDEENLVQAARVMRESGRVQFNFTDIDVVTFIRFMSELLQENIIVPPSIKGTISVISPQPVPLDQARQVMLSVLEMNGLTVQQMGEYSKVIPLKAGAGTENVVRKGKLGPGIGEQVVAQVVPLDYVAAAFVADAVKQVSGKDVGILPIGMGNEILLTGKASEVNRAVSLIQTLDVPDSIRTSRAFQLRYASPRVVAAHLSELAKDKSGPLNGLMATADDASNQVILVGERDTLSEAGKIIRNLDIPARSGDFHVYKLQNADAQTVAEQLSQILAVAARLEASKEGQTPNTVVADVPTNSLIFAAPQHQFQSIMDIIEKIDIQPRQVLLRGLIAEVNLTKLDDAGIDWATWGGTITGDAFIATQAQLGKSSIPDTIISYFRDLTTTEEELRNNEGDVIGTTTTYDSKALVFAYVKMLKQFDAINVLSMPRLLCTDNMPSELQVGQVIPQLSSSASDLSNPSAIQNSYEYKDTGLILNVTPHIRSGNHVSLEIEQSTEDVLSAMSSTTPVTAKRMIKTTVQVGDGKTVILGGLIREAEKAMKQRVPGLSYIPLIGNLFKSSTKQREKIELMVFLTPYILETPSEAEEFTQGIVLSGQHGMSEAEKKIQERLEREYREILRRESR